MYAQVLLTGEILYPVARNKTFRAWIIQVACQDDVGAAGACSFNSPGLHGVWYTFSTDGNAELIDITTDLAGAVFALFEGPCSVLAM